MLRFRLPFSFSLRRKVKEAPRVPGAVHFLSLRETLISLASHLFTMASLTPPPWRLKIRTSLETRLLVTLEDPAATVGDLRGRTTGFQDATALSAVVAVDAGHFHCSQGLEIFSTPWPCLVTLRTSFSFLVQESSVFFLARGRDRLIMAPSSCGQREDATLLRGSAI